MTRTSVLRFSAAAETATGIALLAVPRLVAWVLLGTGLPGVGALVARCFGVALIGLGVATWPVEGSLDAPLQAIRAMVFYNGMIAILLGLAGSVAGLGGALLWPAVVEHALVALLLMRPQRTGPATP